MIQTWALLVDAYRELNARKLFWISIGLSLCCAALLGCLGLTAKGVSVLWWEVPAQLFNANIINTTSFYKWLFELVGFGFWLSWASAILALISTASIIPDFVSSGAIELVLSKPISRLRLFLSKYFVGLFFVGLQVGIFSLAAFGVVGLRGGGWVWSFFWAVPITMLFFSYLFSISALVGLLTRSAIAAIIVTSLVWLASWFVHFIETNALLSGKTLYNLAADVSRSDLQSRREQIAAVEAKIAESEHAAPVDPASPPSPPTDAPPETTPEMPAPKPAPTPEGGSKQAASVWATIEQLISPAKKAKTPTQTQRELLEKLQGELVERESRNREIEEWSSALNRYHAIAFAVKTVLPKTSETMLVLEHKLLDTSERESISSAFGPPGQRRPIMVSGTQVAPRLLQSEIDKALRARSLTWILGTSAAFEAVLLGISCIVFVRRDF